MDETIIFQKPYTTGANINAGLISTERYITAADILKYKRFDKIIIDNKGGDVDMSIQLDGDSNRRLPASKGAVSEFGSLDFKQFQIKNEDAALNHTAGKIKIIVLRTKPVGFWEF